MQEAVREEAGGAHCLALVARGGTILLTWPLPQRSGCDISDFAPLPRVLPLLRWMPRHVPHVRAGAGGQVAIVSGNGQLTRIEVDGETWPVHKVASGGWAQARLQRSAEETLAENAKRIAETAASAAERARAEFIVIGGGVRERTMVLDLLPKALRETAVVIDKEVAPDSAAFGAAAAAEAGRRMEAESRARFEEFRVRKNGEAGRGRRAVEGLDGTLAALRAGLASDVLLAGELGTEAMAWIGPKPGDAAATREQLTERGITPLGTDRADEALVRAAAGAGASLFFIPADVGRTRDGVAALLRAPLAAVVATVFTGGARGSRSWRRPTSDI